jgi:hypothetical protein
MLKRSFSQKDEEPSSQSQTAKEQVTAFVSKNRNPPLDSEDRILHQYCLKVSYYVFFQAVTQLDIGNQG